MVLECDINACCYLFHVVMSQSDKFIALLLTGFVMYARECCCKSLQIVVGKESVRYTFKQCLQSYHFCIGSIHLCGDSMLMLRYANGIDEEEAVFAESIGSDTTQLLIADGAYTTPLHLSIERCRLHVSHKHHHFEWFHIGTCSHQGARHGNAEVLVVAELTDEFVTIASRVGYLLHITVIVALKHLFCNLYDVGSMSLVESKDESLG